VKVGYLNSLSRYAGAYGRKKSHGPSSLAEKVVREEHDPVPVVLLDIAARYKPPVVVRP